MENNSKVNVDLTVKADAKMDITPSKIGADKLFSRIGIALVLLATGASTAWILTAIAQLVG